jgi:uncharacterized protein (TIGR03083 family)
MDDIDTVDLGPAAQRLADLVARVTDDELGNPTPCPAYTVGDLVEHLGGMALAFTAAANKDRNEHNERAGSGMPRGWTMTGGPGSRVTSQLSDKPGATQTRGPA